MNETLQIGLEKLVNAKEKVDLKQKYQRLEKTDLLNKLSRLSEQTDSIISGIFKTFCSQKSSVVSDK